MAELTLDEVQHVAALAYLRFSPEELEHLRGQLESILEHINQLQEVDTAAIPPTAQVIARDERPARRYRAPLTADCSRAPNTPRTEENFIEVDAVLEEA